MKLCAPKTRIENLTFLKMQNCVVSGESASLAGGNKKDPECNRKLKRRVGTSFTQTRIGMELSSKIIFED